jgi:glutamate-1-semialdehyde 2,1-aminomutase
MSNSNNLFEEYRSSHPSSEKLHKRAVEVFAAAGTTHMVRFVDPFRPYITHAMGSRKWDVDGNEYVDYVMGHGGLILGHSHPVVVSAIQEQLRKGIHYGDNHELEVRWAELIREMMPTAERVEYFSCGQEANMMAIRMGRIFTGRRKILRFKENFHGWADELAHEGSAGVVAHEVKIVQCNDASAVEEELAKKEYAVVLIEGGGAWVSGRIPTDINFFHQVAEIAKRYGTVFVLDEVVTGFREAPGGWQSVIGLTPDLTTLGKAVSGGMPSGVLIGRAEIMDALSPKSPPDRFISHSGTWNGVPVICAAGIAACELYKTGEPQIKARKAADYFRNTGNLIFKELGISGCLYGRSVLHLYFGPVDNEGDYSTAPPTRDVTKLMNPKRISIRNRLNLHLLQRGIASLNGEALFLSAAHDNQDVEKTASALKESLKAMILEGSLKAL